MKHKTAVVRSRASRPHGGRTAAQQNQRSPRNAPSSRPTTEILPTHTPELFGAAVRRAAERLRSGDVVALPTETVYGLAANALDSGAVSKIFAIKGRPAHNPIIVHVAELEMARRCVSNWPAMAGVKRYV